MSEKSYHTSSKSKKDSPNRKKSDKNSVIVPVILAIIIILIVIGIIWFLFTFVFKKRQRSEKKRKFKGYDRSNIVSDGNVQGKVTNSNFVNSWGLASSSDGPWWVVQNHGGVVSVADNTGVIHGAVTIPPPASSSSVSAPTGTVFNQHAEKDPNTFVVTKGSKSGPSVFIFVTEDGTISGWNPDVDSANAILAVDNSSTGAVYKGVTIGRMNNCVYLFATNFSKGEIDVFDKDFNYVSSFTDPDVASICPISGQCYAPFNILYYGTYLIVTFALQDADHMDDVAGKGNGYVSVYNLSNNTWQSKFISQGALNAPWGIAVSPCDFGDFSNCLLIGNFGDGTINAFNPKTGEYVGTVKDSSDKVITIDGLWAIVFGNGGKAGSKNILFFTAGPNDENDGQFGSITPHLVS